MKNLKEDPFENIANQVKQEYVNENQNQAQQGENSENKSEEITEEWLNESLVEVRLLQNKFEAQYYESMRSFVDYQNRLAKYLADKKEFDLIKNHLEKNPDLKNYMS